jgi:hypothetical protein
MHGSASGINQPPCLDLRGDRRARLHHRRPGLPGCAAHGKERDVSHRDRKRVRHQPGLLFQVQRESWPETDHQGGRRQYQDRAGIPITLPNGTGDAVDENTPYTLPATGDYVIDMHANTMSEGPFGRFTVTLTII